MLVKGLVLNARLDHVGRRRDADARHGTPNARHEVLKESRLGVILEPENAALDQRGAAKERERSRHVAGDRPLPAAVERKALLRDELHQAPAGQDLGVGLALDLENVQREERDLSGSDQRSGARVHHVDAVLLAKEAGERGLVIAREVVLHEALRAKLVGALEDLVARGVAEAGEERREAAPRAGVGVLSEHDLGHGLLVLWERRGGGEGVSVCASRVTRHASRRKTKTSHPATHRAAALVRHQALGHSVHRVEKELLDDTRGRRAKDHSLPGGLAPASSRWREDPATRVHSAERGRHCAFCSGGHWFCDLMIFHDTLDNSIFMIGGKRGACTGSGGGSVGRARLLHHPLARSPFSLLFACVVLLHPFPAKLRRHRFPDSTRGSDLSSSFGMNALIGLCPRDLLGFVLDSLCWTRVEGGGREEGREGGGEGRGLPRLRMPPVRDGHRIATARASGVVCALVSFPFSSTFGPNSTLNLPRHVSPLDKREEKPTKNEARHSTRVTGVRYRRQARSRSDRKGLGSARRHPWVVLISQRRESPPLWESSPPTLGARELKLTETLLARERPLSPSSPCARGNRRDGRRERRQVVREEALLLAALAKGGRKQTMARVGGVEQPRPPPRLAVYAARSTQREQA